MALACESWCASWACDGSAWCLQGAVPELCLGCGDASAAALVSACESWCVSWSCDGAWCANGDKPKECRGCDSTKSSAEGQNEIQTAASVIDVDAPAVPAESVGPAFGLVADAKAGGHLPSWPFPIAHCSDAARTVCQQLPGSWIGEAWSNTKGTRTIDRKRGIAITGSSRMFYTRLVPLSEQAAKMQWADVAYEKLELLGKSLSFTIDMSDVPCGCNAALYLVQMDAPSVDGGSGYCDIQGFDDPSAEACTELDIIEGNQKALQSTLHTAQGKGEDGRCNQDGCAANWGRREETNDACIRSARSNTACLCSVRLCPSAARLEPTGPGFESLLDQTACLTRRGWRRM